MNLVRIERGTEVEALFPDGTWHEGVVDVSWAEITLVHDAKGDRVVVRYAYDVVGPDPEFGEGKIFTIRADEQHIRLRAGVAA